MGLYDKKKRAFIVGNGPLLMDMSEQVNNSDHVIRFNEPKTSIGMSGTKTTALRCQHWQADGKAIEE